MNDNVIRMPWRRPPLIECPDCGRRMGDVLRGSAVIERYCSRCRKEFPGDGCVCTYVDHGRGGCACPDASHAGDPEHPFAGDVA